MPETKRRQNTLGPGARRGVGRRWAECLLRLQASSPFADPRCLVRLVFRERSAFVRLPRWARDPTARAGQGGALLSPAVTSGLTPLPTPMHAPASVRRRFFFRLGGTPKDFYPSRFRFPSCALTRRAPSHPARKQISPPVTTDVFAGRHARRARAPRGAAAAATAPATARTRPCSL